MVIQSSALSSRKAEGNEFFTRMTFSDFITATHKYTKFIKKALTSISIIFCTVKLSLHLWTTWRHISRNTVKLHVFITCKLGGSSGQLQTLAPYCITKAYENLNICLSMCTSVTFWTSDPPFTKCYKNNSLLSILLTGKHQYGWDHDRLDG